MEIGGWFFNVVLVVAALLFSFILLRPKLRDDPYWQATVTPLASIIGSGFLVVAPLLREIAGSAAILVMMMILLVAWMLGSVVRYNIQYLEPVLENEPSSALTRLEELGDLALALAYVVSVAFYLSLLTSFLLSPFNSVAEIWRDVLTTAILVLIGVVGWRRGLHSLEWLEEYSVSIKLAIIGSLFVALIWYALHAPSGAYDFIVPTGDWRERLRLIAGTLLVVQGFETSRYLGEEYSADMRRASMRTAQIITAAIYILFVLLMTPLLMANGRVANDETAIIGLAGLVAPVLPLLLIVAAVMSQFSAAVADTVGAGGITAELSRHRLRARLGYLLVTGFAIVLIWVADVFETISLASRAFALYYLIQCILALRMKVQHRQHRSWCFVFYCITALVMLAVVIFAKSVE